jgi:hypothetical protein
MISCLSDSSLCRVARSGAVEMSQVEPAAKTLRNDRAFTLESAFLGTSRILKLQASHASTSLDLMFKLMGSVCSWSSI